MNRTVEIIGGGPAGLYFARLIKRAEPTSQVIVHERLDDDQRTFGFGVGLTESTMRNLAAADAETAERVRQASYAGHDLELRCDRGAVTLHGARNLAIGRGILLDILADAARDVGVEYRTGSKMDAAHSEADVIVAADGVRSPTRAKLSSELGVSAELGAGRFVWCGADFAVDSAFFSSVSAPEGLFVAHAYPYAKDRSTFLIEVDQQTWQTAGLAAFDQATPLGETDTQSVALLERVFTAELGGRSLLTNRTRWDRFTTLALDRWSTGNTVLLGDAAHTAHYTLGSGTKLALEDAIALASALSGEGSVEAAFSAYEVARRPGVERFKTLAGRSQRWWESYRARAHWEPESLALSYMTRSGNLGIADYAKEQPEAVRHALSWLGRPVPSDAEQLAEWTLSQPLSHPQVTLPQREVTWAALASSAIENVEWSHADPWGEQADLTVSRIAARSDAAVVVDGDGSPNHIGARLDLAERLRIETDRAVGLVLPATARETAASAIGAGRADFIVRDETD